MRTSSATRRISSSTLPSICICCFSQQNRERGEGLDEVFGVESRRCFGGRGWGQFAGRLFAPCFAVSIHLCRTDKPTVFIKTDQLDGETDWKLRKPALNTFDLSQLTI